MTFYSFDTWWWPYIFMLVAGWAASDAWRFLGAYLGNYIPEDSQIMVLVRCMATALVAGVASSFVLAPMGSLAEVSIALRITATAVCFAVYILTRHSVFAGILAGEAVLIGGLWLG